MSSALSSGEWVIAGMPAMSRRKSTSLADKIFYFCMKASKILSVCYFAYLIHVAITVPEIGFLKLLPFFVAAITIPFYVAALVEDYES